MGSGVFFLADLWKKAPMTDQSAEYLTGISSIAEHYDAFICDLWGVLHDGVRSFPQAVDCLQKLRGQSKKILILSNAPRRATEVTQRMGELGIPAELYDFALSSGEETWEHLKSRRDPWYQALGPKCFHFGPDRDRGMRDGLDYHFIDDLGEADFLLNTGAHLAVDSVDIYRADLERALEQGLPMVCANPDLEVIRGGVREICAGALASHYEELGGVVRYHGKPHAGVYERCFRELEGIEKHRIAAVGDSLRTDIAGGLAAGIDGILVTSGIHGEVLQSDEQTLPPKDRLEALMEQEGHRPRFVVSSFQW